MNPTIYIFKGLEQLKTFVFSQEQTTTLEDSSLSQTFKILFDHDSPKENMDSYFGSWSDYQNSQRTFCLLYDFKLSKMLVFTEISHKVISENIYESRLASADSLLNPTVLSNTTVNQINIVELWNVCRNTDIDHSKGLFVNTVYPALEKHIFQDPYIKQIRLSCLPVLAEKVYSKVGFTPTGFKDDEGYISMVKLKGSN